MNDIRIDERVKEAIEKILNSRKDALVSVRKDGIVVAEHHTKITYSTKSK